MQTMYPESPIPPLLGGKATITAKSHLLKIIAVWATVTACLPLALIAGFHATRKDTIDDYTFLCSSIFEPLPVADTVTIQPPNDEIEALMPQVMQKLAYISWRGRKLAAISRNYSDLIQRAENFQRNPPRLSPVVFSVSETAIGIYTHEPTLTADGGKRALNGTENIWDTMVAEKKLLEDKHVLAFKLAYLAKQFSGPVTNVELLTCSFTRNTPGFLQGPKNSLTLNNSSGQELHNCVIGVSLSNARGDSKINFYFVPDWQNNETHVVNYSDLDFPKDTVSNVDRVDIILLSKECSMNPFEIQKPETGWPEME